MNDEQILPAHVAIIMDGNGRWAAQRGLPRAAGHTEGVRRVREIVQEAAKVGIKVLTLFAFSTENWKRPREEVGFLMRLLEESLLKEISRLTRNNIVFRSSGRLQDLPDGLRRRLGEVVAATGGNTGMVLNIAINYGGRAELIDVVRRLAAQVASGELAVNDIDEETISENLWTAGLPDPDLIIRASGEQRLSNFLLWQAAYSELYVTPVYWPDFGPDQLHAALQDYATRRRRFGGL